MAGIGDDVRPAQFFTPVWGGVCIDILNVKLAMLLSKRIQVHRHAHLFE
jgi:hypothetical protein